MMKKNTKTKKFTATACAAIGVMIIGINLLLLQGCRRIEHQTGDIGTQTISTEEMTGESTEEMTSETMEEASAEHTVHSKQSYPKKHVRLRTGEDTEMTEPTPEETAATCGQTEAAAEATTEATTEAATQREPAPQELYAQTQPVSEPTAASVPTEAPTQPAPQPAPAPVEPTAPATAAPTQAETEHVHDWQPVYESVFHEAEYETRPDIVEQVNGCNMCGKPLYVYHPDTMTFEHTDVWHEDVYYPHKVLTLYNGVAGEATEDICFGGAWHSEFYTKSYCCYCGDIFIKVSCPFNHCPCWEMSDSLRPASSGVIRKEKNEFSCTFWYKECSCGKNWAITDGTPDSCLVIVKDEYTTEEIIGYQCTQCGEWKDK